MMCAMSMLYCVCFMKNPVSIKGNLIQGDSASRSDLLLFYIPFLAEKIPLSYTFHWWMVPLSYPSSEKVCVCSKYFNERLFYIPKWQISLPFYLWLVKSLPFHIPQVWRRQPFWAEPPHMGYWRKYPWGTKGVSQASQHPPSYAPALISRLERRGPCGSLILSSFDAFFPLFHWPRAHHAK